MVAPPTSSTFTRPPLPDLPTNQSFLMTKTPIPVPSYPDPKTMSFSILSRTKIYGPSSVILNTVLDSSNWGEWNTYIPRCDVLSSSTFQTPGSTEEHGKRLLRVGDEMKFYCNMSSILLSDLTPAKIEAMTKSTDVMKIISPLDPATEEGRKGWRIVWTATTTLYGLIRAERVQEIVELEDGSCEYMGYETFGGWIAGVVLWSQGKNLVRGFARWSENLKGRVEEVYRQERA